MNKICCPLCTSTNILAIIPQNDTRTYFHCKQCDLIFSHPDFYLNQSEEKKVYDYHENSIEQPGYVAFLQRVINPGLKYIHSGQIGLDFGCGPTPTLSKLLAREGIKCYDYDPIYGFEAPNMAFDFIFATECFEHFHFPKKEIDFIHQSLKINGYLLLMTEIWHDLAQFESWYYKKDPTHVVFYHHHTFDYICSVFGFKLCYTDEKRVFIFQKIA